MDKHKASVLAGMFACSNMGQIVDEASIVHAIKAAKENRDTDRYIRGNLATLWCLYFCEQFMETDEHQEMFDGECEMWYDRMLADGDAWETHHPDMAALWKKHGGW
jgi:hypothetical protein